MKHILLILLVCALALVVSLRATSENGAAEPSESVPPEPTEKALSVPTARLSAAVDADEATVFTALIDGEAAQVTMAEYLPGVVAGEMPASFETEALKAQSVAARTFILWRMSHAAAAHPEAAICSDAGCCSAYLSKARLSERWGEDFEAFWEKLSACVAETDGQYLSYEGEPIQAAFHSSSAGFTEDSGSLWSETPYLKSVSSPETAEGVPRYVTTVEVSAENLASTVRASYPEAVFEGTADGWLTDTERNASGRVASMTIGGVRIPGAELRTMFALRSTAFTLEWADGSFLFTVTGYGHGVGLSQYGAQTMAKLGASHVEILEHYYSGALVTDIRQVSTPPDDSSRA